MTAIYWENGEFHSDPVCTDPVRNFPIFCRKLHSADGAVSTNSLRSGMTGRRKTYTSTTPSPFCKKAMRWGRKWPVQMNLPFFAVEAYVPGRSRIRPKKFRKMPFGRYRYQTLADCVSTMKFGVWLLSGPLRLRVQSRSRTRLRIAVSIAFLFRACFKGVWDTIAPLSRG